MEGSPLTVQETCLWQRAGHRAVPRPHMFLAVRQPVSEAAGLVFIPSIL